MERSEVEERAAQIMARHFAKVGDHVFKDNDFSNGNLYIQHCKEQLDGALEAALRLAHESCPGYRRYVDEWVSEGNMASIDSSRLHGFFSRYFSEDESDAGLALRVLANRLMLIDWDDSTEWGQGYFVFGAAKGSASSKTCVNPGEALAAWEAQTLRESIGKSAPCEATSREAPRL